MTGGSFFAGSAEGFAARFGLVRGPQVACFRVPTQNVKKPVAPTPAMCSLVQCRCLAEPSEHLSGKEVYFQSSFWLHASTRNRHSTVFSIFRTWLMLTEIFLNKSLINMSGNVHTNF